MTLYRIVEGPSKFDLMLSIFQDKEVTFTLEQVKDLVKAHIQVIEREDGSNERWNLCGYSDKKKFKAYFSTHNRKGHLEFTKEGHL